MKIHYKKILVLALTFVLVFGTVTALAAEARFIYLETYNRTITYTSNNFEVCRFTMSGSSFTLVHNATWNVPLTIDPNDCIMEIKIYFDNDKYPYQNFDPVEVFYFAGNISNATQQITGLESGSKYAITYEFFNPPHSNITCNVSGAVRV